MLHPSRKPPGCKKTALHCPRKGQAGLCVDCAEAHVLLLADMAHEAGKLPLAIGPRHTFDRHLSKGGNHSISGLSNLLKRVFYSVAFPPSRTDRPVRGGGSSPAFPFRSLIIIIGSYVVSVLHRSFRSAFVGVFRKTDGTAGLEQPRCLVQTMRRSK